jgi:HD-like signal output (HDOD) protein
MTEIDWAKIRQEALGDFALAALPPTMSLPALPLAVTQFIEKSNHPKVEIKELARIIDTDTGLMLELLRYVNSTFVGLRHKVKGVLQALTILGLRQSRMFVISTGMQAAVRSRKSKLINQACFWNFTLQKALFAREVAMLMKADPDLAFVGALLQDFLLPVLTNDLCDQYLLFTQSRESQPMNLVDFEQKTFGWNHAQAAACLASRWGLPDDLVCCVLFHHHGLHMLAHPQLGRTSAAAVALSALLPDQLRQCYQGLEHLLLLQQKWTAFDLVKLAETVDEKHEQVGMGVRNDFPLARRCKPAFDGQAQPSEGLLAALS